MKRFRDISFDEANQCLWRGAERIPLAPKPFAVLSHLVNNPGKLVTKNELLDAAWPDTFVQEGVLKVCILELRKILNDDLKEPIYIATEHRRGYRFVAPVMSLAEAAAKSQAGLPGREADLQRLAIHYERAKSGERQIVFVTGEAGIGKSTVVQHFLQEAAREGPVQIASAECIEHFGAREAYYPVFDALARAGRDGTIPGVVQALRRFAPTWLAEMPGLATAADVEILKRETIGATRDRMLREICQAIEMLATEQPLILVFEDLHWSDVSTLDLITATANRSGPARLMLLGTYRPVDAILSEHPVKQVKQALLARNRAVEFELEALAAEDIGLFLNHRFPGNTLPAEFATVVHQRTEGNPLFVKHVLDYAVASLVIGQVNGEWQMISPVDHFDVRVPESLSRMIERQLDQLNAQELEVLEKASIAGPEFSIALIADEAEDIFEEVCDGLARRGAFLQAAGVTEFAGGRESGRYQFTHALYRDVLYRRCPPARRMRLHRSIGERMEKLFERNLEEAAVDLAAHFQECRDGERAIRYLRLVSKRCVSRHALGEGIHAHVRALALTDKLPEGEEERLRLELTEEIGQLFRLMGHLTTAADEFDNMYRQAEALGDTEAQVWSQLHLAGATSWVDRERCLQAIARAVELCPPGSDPDIRAIALGQSAYFNLLFRQWNADDLRLSKESLVVARQLGDPVLQALHASRHSYFEALSSQYRSAVFTAQEGFRLAVDSGSLVDYAIAEYFQAWALLHLGEWGEMKDLLAAAIRRANKNGNHLWALLFGLLDTFLLLECKAYSRALEASAALLVRAKELEHALSEQIALVLLGLSQLHVGNLEDAEKHFVYLRDWQARERILMDWIWRMPLDYGLTLLYLAKGDMSAAKEQSEQFFDRVLRTSERTWIALAYSVRGTDEDRRRGLELVEEYDIPLAALRLNPSLVKQRLADSLGAHEDLRASFLQE